MAWPHKFSLTWVHNLAAQVAQVPITFHPTYLERRAGKEAMMGP